MSPYERTSLPTDADLEAAERDAALGRLLHALGHLAMAATDVESLVRGVLVQLVMNLEAVTGWAGIGARDAGIEVFDSMGRARDAAAVAETARVLSLSTPEEGVARVGPPATSAFPGGAAGGEGLFVRFPPGSSGSGWCLLVGPPGRGLARASEDVLLPTTALLGLAVERLRALDRLRALNRDLEARVEERTQELRREKEGLEVRVAERTRELEEAKRAAVNSERLLLDRERLETAHHLAAGIAHELNNPLGALRANLEFVAEVLGTDPGRPPANGAAEELRAALEDAIADADRMGARVAALFGGTADHRRAAVRTAPAEAVREGIRHFLRSAPGSRQPEFRAAECPATAVPVGELTRWVFRLLGALAGDPLVRSRVSILPVGACPVVALDLDGAPPVESEDTLKQVRREVEVAGGRLDRRRTRAGSRLLLRLPIAVGERRSRVQRPAS